MASSLKALRATNLGAWRSRWPLRSVRALADPAWWSSLFARSPLLRTRGLALATGLTLLLVLLNIFVALQSLQTVRESEQRVAHTHAVLAQLDAVFADLTTAAATSRGYVISGNTTYLRAYMTARDALGADLATLMSLTADDRAQQERASTLKPLIARRMNEYQRAIELAQSGQRDQALQKSVSSTSHLPMNAIQPVVVEMRTAEENVLSRRNAWAADAMREATVTVIIAAIFDILLIAIVFLLVRQSLAFRERVARKQAKVEAEAQVQALQIINQRLNEFVGIAGHELRTPLTSMALNVELAKRYLTRLTDAERAVAVDALDRPLHQLDMMERQVKRQNRLIGDMLDLSRLSAGKLELRIEPADLYAIIRDCVEEQRLLSPARTITLALPPEATCVPVVMDTDRVSQVMMNFLSNALKYSAAETTVAVTVEREGQQARVSVTDAGPGLTSAQQAQVWDPFYRAEGIKVLSDSQIGLGLGLYISREIIARHQGQVGVESALGRGSTFWFTLPLDLASHI